MEKKNDLAIVLKMAMPAVFESFFIALAGLIDSYMVSGINSSAVAAVGLTTQPKFLGMAIFIAINVALSALVARRRGELDKKDANTILSVAMGFTVLATILVSAFMVAFAEQIIRFCGSNEDTHDMAVTYFRIIMGGMFFNVISMCINAAQRGAGNTMIAMKTNITSSIVNVVFNYLLIGGKFGFPALGITGAALATVLGTVVASVMSVISLFKKDNFVSLPYILTEKIKPTAEAFLSIVKLGYSVFIEQILMRIGFMSTAIMAADMGTHAMAAHQVGMNILGVSFSFGDGMQVAAVALIGRSLGERNPEKAKRYGRLCRWVGFCISVCLSLIYFFFGEAMYNQFFPTDKLAVAYGVNIMKIMILIVLFQVSQVIYMGCLRGAGDTAYTAMASTISVTIIRTGVSYFCGYILNWGMVGIWMGIVADQLSRLMLGSIRFGMGKWTKIKI